MGIFSSHKDVKEGLRREMRGLGSTNLLPSEVDSIIDRGLSTRDATLEDMISSAGLRETDGSPAQFSADGRFKWQGNKGTVTCADAQVLGMRDFGKSKGIDALIKPHFPCADGQQWPLCNLAIGLGLGLLVYKGNMQGMELYLLLVNPTIQPN